MRMLNKQLKVQDTPSLKNSEICSKMAVRTESVFRKHLEEFELSDVEFTGEKLKGGAGSYGYVEVVNILGTCCAAKVIHSILEDIEEGDEGKSPVEYFKEECTLMSKLRHPHIVQFLGVCYPRGAVLPALVMELLMTCLHNCLESNERKKRVIPMATKQSILRDVSKGLVYLHNKNIVHRDLTARNVLLSESLTAKIADLGMARLLSLQGGRRAATLTKVPGNAHYMPPEACDAGSDYVAHYGKSIDSFSIGHLILFTVTQKFLEPRKSTYFDKRSGRPQALTEIERRENSFTAVHSLIGEEHPLTRLAVGCLQDDPDKRPIAPEIMEKLEEMPVVPYRTWRQSKRELIQEIVEQENIVRKLETELTRYQESNQQWRVEKEQLVQELNDLRNENLRLSTIGLLPWPSFQPLAAQVPEYFQHTPHEVLPPAPHQPPRTITRSTAQGQEYTGQGQPRGPSSQRYEEQQQQTHSANACHRGSAPAFSQQSPQYPTQTQGGGAQGGGGIYMNLPLLRIPLDNAADQQPEDPGYVNVGKTPNTVSPYEEVPLLKDKPPFSPPNPFNLPEPIVQSRFELERLNALTSEAMNFDPDSIVNAHSDPIGYSGPSFESLISIQSPEQASMFDQQAEDAWRVGTLPPTSEHSGAKSVNKDLTQAKAAEQPTTGNSIRNELGAAENSHVSSPQNSNTDDNVTQEWLDLTLPDDDYQNENYQQQHKDLKSYDKPVPKLKEKAFSKQLSFQPPDSENQGAVNGDEAHQMHSAESLQRNQPDTRGAPNTTQPAIGSDMPFPKSLNPGKSKTNPILSGKHTVPHRPHTSPHTSPLSSLDSNDYDKLPHLLYGQDTLLEGNCDSDEAYGVIDIKGGTIKESVMYPASEDHPTHTQRSLSHTTYDSLSEHQPRSRENALSCSKKSPSPISRRKRNPPRQKSLDTGLFDHGTSRATGGGGKNDHTKKYLDTISATPLFPSEGGRDHSHSHTDLDNSEKKHLRSSPSKSGKSSGTLLPVGSGATVSNTWVCGYCTNFVFDGRAICDCCGHPNPAGSIV